MEIRQVTENKKQYLPLLLLATDGQESALDEYLESGDMYVLDDDGVKCQCIVTDEGDGILEIKNIATAPEGQGKGYGKKLINFIIEKYKATGKYTILQVGTGDSPMTVPFYEKCGFVRSHVVKNFFIEKYDHPIFECGIQLVDMVYLRQPL
ncbi:MAG: GNAT family N-acetyltransferase [Clostridia bacterium]|nr:GNAT family N-acetyltransferase [Clostridia bacterium]